MAEDVNKLTDEEVGAIIQARYNSEMRQPENEEQRKLAEERLSLIHISEPTRRLRGSRMPSSA